MISALSDSERQHKRMIETPVPQLVTALALPTVISQLITLLYNTADTYFVSQLNTQSTAAVGVVFSLMSIIQAVGFGLGMGANSLISRSLGAKRDEEGCKFAASALFAAFFFGVLLLVSGLLFLAPLMRFLGSSESVLPYSCSYAKYILLSAPVMCASFVLNNILRSEGEAFFAMWGLCAGGLVNLILDPLLIFHFKLGIRGAAIATALSQCVSFLLLSSVFLCGKSIVKLQLKNVSFHFADYCLIVRTGIPTVARQGLGSLSTALLNIFCARYGDAILAAVTIAGKLYMVIRFVIIGIGQGYQPVAGYNYGAKRSDRVKSAFRFSVLAGSVICILFCLGVFVFAEEIARCFRNDAEVVAVCRQNLHYLCAAIPFLAYSTYVNQTYQSLGFNTGATFLASCRQGIFFIPLLFLLNRVFGLAGVLWVQSAADICTFLISIPFQMHFFRKHLQSDHSREKHCRF